MNITVPFSKCLIFNTASQYVRGFAPLAYLHTLKKSEKWISEIGSIAFDGASNWMETIEM